MDIRQKALEIVRDRILDAVAEHVSYQRIESLAHAHPETVIVLGEIARDHTHDAETRTWALLLLSRIVDTPEEADELIRCLAKRGDAQQFDLPTSTPRNEVRLITETVIGAARREGHQTDAAGALINLVLVPAFSEFRPMMMQRMAIQILGGTSK